MNLPETVTVIEVATRDGFQVESKPIPTHLKVETIDALTEAGVRQIQVTSFVHPKWVPQMADAEEVCRSISRKPDVIYSALALNKKGVERAHAAGISAHAAGISHLDLSISVSDTHSRKNTNVSLAEAMKNLREMVELARQEEMELRVGLQCVFGCAYEGTIPADRVVKMAEEIFSMEIDMFSLADTTGMANPLQVKQLLSKLLPLLGDTPVILHLHDTRGAGLANLVAALECRGYSLSFALHGCPDRY
jgi:hydroxymethylglutaryl-CoA lyase